MSENKSTALIPYQRSGWYTVARGLFFTLSHTVFPVRYHNTEICNVLEPPYILIANHLSGFDPLAIASPIKKHEVHFLAKAELAENKILGKLIHSLHIIPVKRHGTDITAMRECVKTLREGQILGIFPEGTRHQKKMMETVESGTAMLAMRTRVPLLPVYIDGKIRSFRKTDIYFGEPIDFSDLLSQGINNETMEALSNRIRDTFYAMKAKVYQ